MSDFVSSFWSYFVALIALGGIIYCVILLFSQRAWLGKTVEKTEDTGHVWDGNLSELNNPVPRWWTVFYLGLCIFALVYLVLYPGLGSFKGVLHYSTAESVREAQAAYNQQLKPIYERYASMSIPEIATDEQARQIGQRLFLNNCAQCHGSDARGGPSFPNLTDGAWLYGGDPEISRIETLLVQDPQLCALLFKRVHAASGERVRRATSLHQVIMLLGFDKIRALATTLLLAYDQPIKRFLVLKALVRAALARRLADHMDGVDPDMAFTVGLFSMMDQIEGLSLADTIGEARLDTVMADALLRHEGELGKILKLILAFENASLDDAALSQLGQLNGDYLASVAWAQDIIALSDAS